MRTLFLVLLVILITGCGGSGESSSSTATSVSVSKSSVTTVSSKANLSLASSIKSSAVSSAQSSSASSVRMQSVNDKGFTVIKPSTDSKLIYVSNSEGNDSNDCLSIASPCKTINAGRNKMRAGFPDHLYLKRGDVWRDQILTNFQSGRSASEPAVIAFYGETGARPKLENSEASSIGRGDVRYIHIIGLEFYAYKLDPAHPEFTGLKGDGANIVMIANHNGLLFEDNKFNYIEVVAHKFTNDQGITTIPRNITLRRNIWTGYYFNESSYHRNTRPSNIYAGVWDNFALIENVFDHGGWNETVVGAGANMYNHNIYLQEGVVTDTLIKGNIITRGSSHGIQMRSGGLAEDNFFGRNAIGLSIGYKEDLLPSGIKAYVINNVVSEGHSMIKGIDPCQNNIEANLCTSALWGLDLGAKTSNFEYKAEGNIVSLLAPGDEQWRAMEGAIRDDDGNVIGTYKWEDKYQLSLAASRNFDESNVVAQDNVFWKWSLNPVAVTHTYPDPDRTLADYNAHLGGQRSFEAFINIVTNRPLQTWDEKYTAYSINDYIRAGFGINEK